MKHPTEEHLKNAQANIAIAMRHMDEEPSVAFQHVTRAMKELKDAEINLWNSFRVSGVPYPVKVPNASN
jgi:hypothetical protein